MLVVGWSFSAGSDAPAIAPAEARQVAERSTAPAVQPTAPAAQPRPKPEPKTPAPPQASRPQTPPSAAPVSPSPKPTAAKPTGTAPTAKPSAPAPTVEVEFSRAAGIPERRLEEIVAAAVKSGLPNFPLGVVFRNDRDDCLVDVPVKASWQGGSATYVMPSTGRLLLALLPERVKGLKFAVPPGFTRLRQTSIAEGSAYQAPAKFDYFDADVTDDSEITARIQRRLIDLHREGRFTPMDALHRQLARTRCGLTLPDPGASTLSAANIFRELRRTVVVMAGLSKDGQTRISSGVVIAPDGIVATNYHVVKGRDDATVVLGAMLADGRVVPVREVLAADRASDVALVRIEARDLPCAPLSAGEPVGAPVTIIAHPNRRYYFLTHGYVCRYGKAMHAGDERVYLEVSAEFMPGSSGGPAFSADGAVAGIVSTITQTDKGMTFKQCIPVQSIRRLIDSPTAASR